MAMLLRGIEAATFTVSGATIGELFGHYPDSALWGGLFGAGLYFAYRGVMITCGGIISLLKTK